MHWRFLNKAGLFVLALSIASCASVGPNYQAPEVDLPEAYSSEHNDTALNASANLSLKAWWENFNDPILNELVNRAIANNLDLQSALASLREARAQRGIVAADLYPAIIGSADITRYKTSENYTDYGPYSLFELGFDASWELDFFGKNQRIVESATAFIGSQQEALHGTLISVLSELALNYVEVRTLQARLDVAQENLDSQATSLKLLQSRFEAGMTNNLAPDQARTNIETTRADIPTLYTALKAAINRLSTLIGEHPGYLKATLSQSKAIPADLSEVNFGIPADLLRQRPDIRQAERSLAAATANVGVATAALYPSFSLSGAIGLQSLQSDTLFSSSSDYFSLIPAVSLPIFNAGKIRSNIEVKDAALERALIQYENTVLKAFEEVENSLVAYANERIRNKALRLAAASAERAANTAQERFDGGVSDFLVVLDAQRTRLSAQDSLTLSDAAIISNLIRLYKALGGGWETFTLVNKSDSEQAIRLSEIGPQPE